MINPKGLADMLMGTWDATKQPLKERGVIAPRDVSSWGQLIDVPDDHPTLSVARGINALGSAAGVVGGFGAEMLDALVPWGTYQDGSQGPALPAVVAAPIEGLQRFGDYGYGEDAVPYNAIAAFDAAGGAMTGGLATGLAGGLADNAVGSAGGKLAKPTITRTYLDDQIAALDKMLGDGLPSGLASNSDGGLLNVPSEAVPVSGSPGTFYRGVAVADKPLAPRDDAIWWASSSPRVAGEYAPYEGSAVIPSEARFTNPMVVDGQGSHWSGVPFEGQPRVTNSIVDEAKSRGHDGVVFKNIIDDASGVTPSDVIAAFQRGTVYSPLTGDLLYSNAKPGAAIPLATQAAERQGGKATAPRPEPEGLIPKAEAMGADVALPGGSSGNIAETAPISVADYIARVKGLVDDGEEGPFFGPRTGADDDAIARAYEGRFRNELDARSAKFDDWQYSDAGERTTSPYLENATAYGDQASAVYTPYVASGLEAAARAAGRDLSMYGASSGSQYGELLTPAGNKYKVRVANHAKTSSQYDKPDFNIAPGAWTPEDFLTALPTIYANAKPGASIPLATQAAEQNAPQGIRAYHGSPHDFDQFSLDKIGTGEGWQGVGHGLYFGGAEGTGRWYRDQLTRDKPVTYGDNKVLSEEARNVWANNDFDIGKAADDVSRMIANASASKTPFVRSSASRYKRLLEEIKAAQAGGITPPGRMYEVNIRANPEDFLDWASLDEATKATLNTPSGAKAAAARGVPGVKYADAVSRTEGGGESNYVVFDDQLIDILRKYANAPTGAAIPMGLEAQDDTDPALLEVLRSIGLY